MNFKFSLVLFGLSISILFVFLAEYFSRYFLIASKHESHPMIFNFSKEETPLAQSWDNDKEQLGNVDPLLGFAYTDNYFKKRKTLPGYVIHSDETKENFLNHIVVYGGSTTAPGGSSIDVCDYDWPSQLYKLLINAGFDVILYNGGVPGYSTSQEYLKFIRDISILKPNIVISLNGVNDLGFLHMLPKHPLHHRYHLKLYQYITTKGSSKLFPNTNALFFNFFKKNNSNNFTLGPINNCKPIDQWLRNIKFFSGTCNEFDITFLSFLQPIMGFGRKQYTLEETVMLNEKPKGYLTNVEEFYLNARKLSKELHQVIDITDIFDDQNSTTYVDPRHQNKFGVQLLATRIFNEIIHRNVLNSKRP